MTQIQTVVHVDCNVSNNLMNYINSKRFMLNCEEVNLDNFINNYLDNLQCKEPSNCNVKKPCNTKTIIKK